LSYLVNTQTDRQTDRQTNKQTNKVWQKHYLLGGGNYNLICANLALCTIK